jgi:hypothetical protein
MFSRVLSAVLSLFLFLITGPFLAWVFARSRVPIREGLVILLVVNTVVLWVTWKFVVRYRRYASMPFQVRQSYRLRLCDWEATELGVIGIDGPALLVLRSSLPLTQFALRDLRPGDGTTCKQYIHGSKEIEILVQRSGRWSGILTARAPRAPFSAIQFRQYENGVLAAITLEVRSHGSIRQLPEGEQEPAKGFPVVIDRPNDGYSQ